MTERWVLGTPNSSYNDKKLMNVDGTRVLKDHTRDGIMDPENPLNLQWIGYDENDKSFSVKIPDEQVKNWLKKIQLIVKFQIFRCIYATFGTNYEIV